MPAAPRFFLLPNGLALALAILTWYLWPAPAELWRKVLAVALSMGLGYQIATALRAQGVTAARAWLECVAFLLAMGAVLCLPALWGWILLAGGIAWGLLVRSLWR